MSMAVYTVPDALTEYKNTFKTNSENVAYTINWRLHSVDRKAVSPFCN